MKTIPTIRSHFSFEQFEGVFQKLAHKIAVEAVTKMNKGTVRIDIHGSRLSTVALRSGGVKIRFFAAHLKYEHAPEGSWDEWWGFDIEKKFYLTSSHKTKISFWAPDGKEKERKEKITKFLDELMTEAGIKPVPRFSLANHVKP